MGHKSRTNKRKVAVPQINTPTLEELQAKKKRLLGLEETCPTHELHIVSAALAKVNRRIERMTTPAQEEKKKEEKKKLTKEEKAQKKKDYERRRKNRYKRKEK